MFKFSNLFATNDHNSFQYTAIAPDKIINLGHPGAKPEDFANVATPTRLPSRPGDTEPRQFVDRTLDTLNKTLTSYSTERDLLAKDIAKLNNEYAQLETSLDAIKAAIDKLSQQATPVEAAVAQALEAEFPTNDGTK